MKNLFRLLALITVVLISVSSMSAQSKGKRKAASKKAAAPTEQTVPAKSAVVEYDDEGMVGEIFPIFIEIYDPGDAKCQKFDKVFEQVAAKRQGQAEFYRIDLTKYPEAIDWFDIHVLPTVVTLVGEGESDYHGCIYSEKTTVDTLLRHVDLDIKNWKFYYGR